MDKCTLDFPKLHVLWCHIPTFTNPVTRSSISLSFKPENRQTPRLAFVFVIAIRLQDMKILPALVLTGQQLLLLLAIICFQTHRFKLISPIFHPSAKIAKIRLSYEQGFFGRGMESSTYHISQKHVARFLGLRVT